MEDERIYWIWLAEALGQGSVAASRLVRRFGSPRAVFENGVGGLEPDHDFGEDTLAMLRQKLHKPSLELASGILARCESRGISVLTFESEEYPAPLRTLRDFPLVLYTVGKLPDCSSRLLTACVGTRKMTDYGRRVAYSLGAGLAFGGAVVVSGMALGADSMALIGALDAGGQVIAVLGSGVDVVYPADHREIYRQIARAGAVISEYPPGSPPVGSHFPVRNRIMSGLSDATVVVEAPQGSGALITAKHAVEQGRVIFAVPGNVGDPGAEGTNALIRDIALPALCAEDILSEFSRLYEKTVSVDACHAAMRDLDLDALSFAAMNRARVGTGGRSNLYGRGSLGGRASDFKVSPREEADRKFRKAHESGSAAQALPKDSEKPQPAAGETPKPERTKAEPAPAPKPAGETPKPEKTKTEPAPAPKRTEKKEGETSRGAVRASQKEKVFEKSEEQSVNSGENFVPAKKIELDMLDESEIKVYNKMKPSVPCLPDELVDAEFSISSVMSALTVLEMAGAVESGGGGYFMRVSPDDLAESPND